MDVIEENLPVKMWRANLDNVPQFALPAGFAVRRYQSGDEAHWRRIHLAADHYNRIAPALFREQFGSDDKLLCERQLYLLGTGSEAVGTGTAWLNNDFDGGCWGRVHWMAILPEFQGRGLANALLTEVCQRLRELGHDRAYLSTSTARVRAINLYLKFGFKPMINTQQEEVVWKRVLAVLPPAPRPPA